MTDRSSKWHTTRDSKMRELFEGKKFEIVEEVNSKEPLATPLGYKIHKGYRLRSTDGTMDFYAGKSLVNKLADDFDAVTKPEAKRRGRPRKGPLEQAEVWADRDMPDDAQQVTQAGPTYGNPNASEHL